MRSGPRWIVVAYVRSRNDGRDPVSRRGQPDLPCLLDGSCAIVEPRQDVRVEVDHAQTIEAVFDLSVLHVAQPEHAGVPVCVGQLLDDQVRRRMRVALACPQRSDVVARAAELGVEHFRWEATRSPGVSVPSEIRRLSRIVAEVEADIVHLHSSKAGLAGRLAIRGRQPTVFHPHGWSFEAMGDPMRRLALAWERHAARWTSVTVCVSDDERQRGLEAGIAGAFHVVPNGVDLARFPFADEADRARARARLRLSEEPLVVCVGRIARQKGQDVLLEAWPSVLDYVPDARACPGR